MAIRARQEPVADSPTATCRKRRGAGIRPGPPVAIAIFLVLLAVALAACGAATTPNADTSQGDRAPNFDFTLFQGQETLGAASTNLHQLTGKPVVLNFWAGLCPPCRAEMPDLQEFYHEFKDRVTLVGIDLEQFTGLGTLQDAKDLLEELEITYPTGSTSDSSVISKYKVFGMPTTIFIDADGRVFRNWGGALNLDVLREQTNKMLSQ